MALGLCSDPPCNLSITIAADDIEIVEETLFAAELNAFYDGNYPKESDPDYQLFHKYGWLADSFVVMSRLANMTRDATIDELESNADYKDCLRYFQ